MNKSLKMLFGFGLILTALDHSGFFWESKGGFFVILIILVFLGVVYSINLDCREKRREARSVDEIDDEAIPLCLGCLRPVDMQDYYCPKCGAATGQFTMYIPFINIRFNYSIFGPLWQKLWYEREVPLLTRCGYLILILFQATPMFVFGLPFVVIKKIKSRRVNRKEAV